MKFVMPMFFLFGLVACGQKNPADQTSELVASEEKAQERLQVKFVRLMRVGGH